MPADHTERRLAAILAADMVGYSRLMEADEAGTIARQKAHRKELIDPKIAELLAVGRLPHTPPATKGKSAPPQWICG